MLDLSKPLTAGKIKEYFKEEYGAAENSYFSQGGTIRGEWQGALAHTFGLTGPVEGEAFNRLAEGQHPLTGEQLIKHKDTIKTQSGEELGHRAGWDFTFKPGKSVSVTALVGEDDRVRVAHRRGVSVALDALEQYVQARMSAIGPPETTGKWIAAKFEHDTARPVNGYPAPQLHTHVIVFNMTEDSQGFAHSLQPYELFRVQSMATAVYKNALEHDLRALGYQIERGKNHAPEIKGYTPEYLESESQRSALIRQALEAKGLRGAEAASIAAHAGREEKLKLSPSELKKLHQTHAAEFGNQPSKVVAEAAQRQPRELSVDKLIGKATAAVAFARERLSERSQVLEHFEIVRDALRYVQGRASLQDVEAAISVHRVDGKLQEVGHIRPFAPAHRYTTPEAFAAEREIIDKVRAGRGHSEVLGSVTSDAVNARFSSLNEDQQALIVSVLQSRDQISGIQGRAGTGKTTAMAAIRELAEENGYKAIGLGPTSKATKGLKEAGMEAENLAAYLARGGAASEDSRPRLFFVDEASLTSTKSVRDFLRTVQPQDRVLLIGDTRQHQSVEAGRIFDQLQDAGMQTATLSKIVRQKDEGLRQAVELLAAGKTGEALDLLESQQRITEVNHRGQRFESIAKEYAASPDGTLVISPDNESRKELNAAIRAAMRRGGHVSEDAFSAPILIHRQDVTAADKGRATTYRPGDTIRYRNGSDVFGIAPKSYGTVLAAGHESNQVAVKLGDGKVVNYDPARLRGVSLYTPESRPLAVGDRIQFTAPWKDQAIANRDLATVTYLDQSGNIRASLDDSGRTVGWNLRDYAHVDYAYTMTSHSAQGVTVDRALIHVDTSDSKARALIDQTLAYVAGSRPALLLSIVMKEGWNGLDLGKALVAEQKKISGDLPAGISFSKVTDQAVNIREAVDEFMLKFFVALTVVMVVSFISLGWREGIVVAAAVPLTLAAVFVIMLMTGRVFDRITLGALILGLGLLVDDAIISIEIMVVKMEAGWNRVRAAGYAWSHTAAPMLAGTLVTVIGLTPVGFARSSAGEYAGNIFWVVGFALLTSWIVAVTFTPYLGVQMLPEIAALPGGHEAIYATPGYKRLRRVIAWAVRRKVLVACVVLAIFLASVAGMGLLKQQFFPQSDRPELLVEVTAPQGTSIETTNASTKKVEDWLRLQPEAKIVTAYIGAGAPRFFFSYNPELPNPNFAKIVVLTADEKDRDHLKLRLRERVEQGLAPEARVRASQLVFGPYSPWPIAFRVMGPNLEKDRAIAAQVQTVMLANTHTRQVNQDWGERAPSVHFVLDQARLQLIGLSSREAAEQIQFLLTGAPVTQVREDIRTVEIVARSGGDDRLDPRKLNDMTLTNRVGKAIPLSQVGHIEIRPEEPILKRRDRLPTITVESDIDESLQPPQVSLEIEKSIQPIIASLPEGYKIEMGANIEDAGKANRALATVFPAMIVLMLTVIILQVRSFSGMFMVALTAPLGLAGVVPTLLLFHQPFGFNAILGLIALAGILMRNTLILIGQIKTNQEEGLDSYHSVVEATVQRSRPVILTALAAVLAFIPLTYSVFWGSMAYTLIGGTAVGTVLTLVFLPALYSIWFRVKPATVPSDEPQPVLAGS